MEGLDRVEAAPHELLREWIDRYWIVRFRPDAIPARVPFAPDASAQLVLRTESALLFGPRTVPAVERAADDRCWLGVRFRPGAARAFLAPSRGPGCIPPLRDAAVDVTWFPGLAWASRLGGALDGLLTDADRFAFVDLRLRERRVEARRPDTLVRAWLAALGDGPDGPSVAALARTGGLSSRQLRRRFLAEVDLAPKQFARIARFLRCAGAALGGAASSWADRAAEHGYADQSHLNREFRRLAGIAPGELARRGVPGALWMREPPAAL